MSRPYRFRAESVATESFEGHHEVRDEWLLFVEIAFRPKSKRKRGLFLIREWVGDGPKAHFAGDVGIRVIDNSSGAGDGITAAILTRDSLRVTVNADAAAAIEASEVFVEFDLDELKFAELRRELSDMFADFGVYREEIA